MKHIKKTMHSTAPTTIRIIYNVARPLLLLEAAHVSEHPYLLARSVQHRVLNCLQAKPPLFFSMHVVNSSWQDTIRLQEVVVGGTHSFIVDQYSDPRHAPAR
eukprot:TRINITY_DN16273_c0_g1_i2.p1 TRINITY_DN16273_c0_g1~~TRINITY_DN16273_c0_g1_i2.p1  ORF type:complete len:102 (-),score=14.94 TRINITY_DN16273_c0_g1_i2:60-365(-)